MLCAMKSKDAAEAGLNPFVYGKAKNYARNYGKTTEEAQEKLRQMSANLCDMYHEAHRGNIDFAVGLEMFILGL